MERPEAKVESVEGMACRLARRLLERVTWLSKASVMQTTRQRRGKAQRLIAEALDDQSTIFV